MNRYDKKEIHFDDNRMYEGIKGLGETVVSTLGPMGRNVIFEILNRPPHITKDGVTVAKQIVYKDDVMNIGAQAIKEVAENVVEKAGDGTTTATLLAWKLIAKGRELIEKGITTPLEAQRTINKIARYLVLQIEENRISIEKEDYETLGKIASISSNSDNLISGFLTEAVRQVGIDGTIEILNSRNTKTNMEVTKGFRFEGGYLLQEYVNVEEKNECHLEKPLIAIYQDDVLDIETLKPSVDMAKSKGKPIIFVARSFKRPVQDWLKIVNEIAGVYCVAVPAPGFGDMQLQIMGDIAIATGGMLMARASNYNLHNPNEDAFGTAEYVQVSKTHTTIIKGERTGREETAIANRQTSVINLRDSEDDEYQKKIINNRLKMLNGGVAVIYVGGHSQLEQKERVDRMDDALQAVKAAAEEGYLPGGGSALAYFVDEFLSTEKIESKDFIELIRVFREPYEKILTHAEIENTQIEKKLTQFGLGLSVNGKQIKYVEEGIIDPAKVTRVCVEQASSVAGTILTTSAIITILEKAKNIHNEQVN